MSGSRQLFHRLSLSSRYRQFSELPSSLLYWWTGRCIMHARLQLSLIILLIPQTYAAWLSIYRKLFTHRDTSRNRAARVTFFLLLTHKYSKHRNHQILLVNWQLVLWDQEMLHVTNVIRVQRLVYSSSTHVRRDVHSLLQSQQTAPTMEELRNTTSNYSLQQEPTSVHLGPQHVEQRWVKAFWVFFLLQIQRKYWLVRLNLNSLFQAEPSGDPLSHLESIRTGAVVRSGSVGHTGAVILAGRCQAGGALRHQADIYWTWDREQTVFSHIVLSGAHTQRKSLTG